MAKIDKFLSIGIGILQEKEKKEFDDMTAGLLRAALEKIEASFEKEQKVYPKSEQIQKGVVDITVQDDRKEKMPVQVKFFPLFSEEDTENSEKLFDNIKVIRTMTDEEGKLKIELPCQDYVMELSKGSEYEIKRIKLTVDQTQKENQIYTLHPFIDMRSEHFYAGDIHHHSIYSSPVYGGDDDVKETPAEVCNSMRANGLSFGALSDHHNVLNHDEWKKQKKEDFYPVISKEISTSNGHVMSFGVEKDIIYQIPKPENRKDEVLRNEFNRIVDEIKEEGGMAQINHPRDLNPSISWNPNFNDMLTIFDTMEIWNGSNPMYPGTTNYKAAMLWGDLLEQEKFIPATTGSDTHNIKADDYGAIACKIIWLTKEWKRQDIKGILQEKYKKEMRCLEEIIDKAFPIMFRWALANLSSGGVRTYAYIKGDINTQNIIHSLKQGNTFMTNGPILIPTLNGKRMGEKAGKAQEADIRILSNRPLKHLFIYGSGKKFEKKSLFEKEETKNKNYYDYSDVFSINKTWECKWLIFVVASDESNMAIANPIFLS